METRRGGREPFVWAERIRAAKAREREHAARLAARFGPGTAEGAWLEAWARALGAVEAEAAFWTSGAAAGLAGAGVGALDVRAAAQTHWWNAALAELYRRTGIATWPWESNAGVKPTSYVNGDGSPAAGRRDGATSDDASPDGAPLDDAPADAFSGAGIGSPPAAPPAGWFGARPPIISEGTWSGGLPPSEEPVPVGGHALPPLPYAYDALAPHLDAETIRIHHDILHRNYVEGLNRAERMLEEARRTGDFSLIKHWERELAFHGAGHYLHTVYFNGMSPEGGGEPSGHLAAQIDADFGGYDAFRRHFAKAAESVEGAGWGLLVWSPRARRLQILQAEKHQNLTQWDDVPIIALDVWEHSYYLTYRNERARYIDAWFEVVNWPYAAERYLAARRLKWRPY